MAKTTLLDDIQAELESTSNRCKLAKIYDALNLEDRLALASVLEDPAVSAPTIARVLTKRDFPISENAVKRCRKHECWKESV